jgi:hypothetical protein
MILWTPRTCGRLLSILCCCTLSAGCGQDDGIGKLYPVSGRILVDGRPLTGVAQGSVSFRGDPLKGNETLHQPTGPIDAEGRFELVTAGKKGAPPGWYKVVVTAYANKLEEGPVRPRLLLVEKYYHPKKTDLSVEVVADPAPGAYDLNVIRAAAPKR